MEAHLYDGIKEVLEQLSKDPNKKIFITTSKNEPIALEMCQHLGITEYFEGIYGSTPAAFHKADVLQMCIRDRSRSFFISSRLSKISATFNEVS